VGPGGHRRVSRTRANNPPSDCADSRGLTAIAIALSRDGRNAYVTSDTGAIAVYRRAR
jgi:hypothetical protein